MRIVVLAPNWLGDAVLALPAIAAVRHAHPAAHLAVAARRSVADLFQLASGVDASIALESDGRWWRRAALRSDIERLRGFDLALLLPNSFQSAWMARAAGIAERWGYASDARSRLLTRAVPRSTAGHQAEYYQRLVDSLGIPTNGAVPEIDVAEAARVEARTSLTDRGHQPGAPLVVLAPGAAYGKAKQWIPAYVAEVIARLIRDHGTTCVIVGGAADRSVADSIRRAVSDPGRDRAIDVTGQTSLAQLAAVLAIADVCVCNDSGAMHLAAAVGTPVVATFGPTNEHATRPLPRPGRGARVLTHDVWCRPCMLRECPIDHRCMIGITPDRVYGEVSSSLRV